jgi:hypothetical protein
MSSEESIRNIIQQYIDGTFEGDGNKLRNCFHHLAVMNGYLDGKLMMGAPESFIQQVESMPSMREGGIDYKAEISAIDITGHVATATLTETGFAGQMDFVDYFHLINDGDSWKIISKNFTTK